MKIKKYVRHQPLTEEQKAEILKMAKEGLGIDSIHRTLRLPYSPVKTFVVANGPKYSVEERTELRRKNGIVFKGNNKDKNKGPLLVEKYSDLVNLKPWKTTTL